MIKYGFGKEPEDLADDVLLADAPEKTQFAVHVKQHAIHWLLGLHFVLCENSVELLLEHGDS